MNYSSGFVQIFESKIQDFFQNSNFFFQTRWSTETFKNAETKRFSWCTTRVGARLNKIWPKWKALKKKPQDLLSFSQTLSSFSKLFPGLENCWANFKTFSRIQASVWTLIITKGYLIKKIIMIWLIKILFVISTIIWPKITLSYNSIYIIISSNFFYVN